MKIAHKGQVVKKKFGYYHYIALEDSYLGKISLKRTDANIYLWEPVDDFIPAVKKKSELSFMDYVKGIPVIMIGILANGCSKVGFNRLAKSLMEKYYKLEYELIGVVQPGKWR